MNRVAKFIHIQSFLYVDKYLYSFERFKPLGNLTSHKINLFLPPCQVDFFHILNNEK